MRRGVSGGSYAAWRKRRESINENGVSIIGESGGVAKMSENNAAA